MTLAKGLASACRSARVLPPVRGRVYSSRATWLDVRRQPLACAAALATLDIIEAENLMANATAMGDFIRDGLHAKLTAWPAVREIRGKGLMIGIELDFPCGELVMNGLDAGLLINVTTTTWCGCCRRLTIKRDECEVLVTMLAPLIADFLARSGAAQPAAKTV